MTPEGRVKEKVKAVLKSHNVYWFMPRGTVMGRNGVPDFVCCANGIFIAIECKAGKNKLTPLQEVEKNKIRASNGIHLVIDENTIAGLENALKYIIGEKS